MIILLGQDGLELALVVGGEIRRGFAAADEAHRVEHLRGASSGRGLLLVVEVDGALDDLGGRLARRAGQVGELPGSAVVEPNVEIRGRRQRPVMSKAVSLMMRELHVTSKAVSLVMRKFHITDKAVSLVMREFHIMGKIQSEQCSSYK